MRGYPGYSDRLGIILTHETLMFTFGEVGITPYSKCLHRRVSTSGGAKAGDVVLVHGASGAVGLAAVQLAANNGMIVVGTAGTEEGMKLIKDNGAKFAFNHRDPGYLNDLKESIGGTFIGKYDERE